MVREAARRLARDQAEIDREVARSEREGGADDR
jgi:hypothetical protein